MRLSQSRNTEISMNTPPPTHILHNCYYDNNYPGKRDILLIRINRTQKLGHTRGNSSTPQQIMYSIPINNRFSLVRFVAIPFWYIVIGYNLLLNSSSQAVHSPSTYLLSRGGPKHKSHLLNNCALQKIQ